MKPSAWTGHSQPENKHPLIAEDVVVSYLTSDTMSSPVSPGASGMVEERMADWIPVMKTWAVLSLSSVQLSAPESDTTASLLVGLAPERKIVIDQII